MVSMRLASMEKPLKSTVVEDVAWSAGASGLVAVAFADTAEDAEHYCSALDHMDVPALIGCQDQAGVARARAASGMPVLVPEHLQDRASEILACLEATASDDWDDEDEDEEEEDDYVDDDEDEDFDPDDDFDDDFDEDEDEDLD